MAIYSTFLGSTTFTGDDAKAFDRFMKHGRVSQAAKSAAQNGVRLLHEFDKKGFVNLKLNVQKRSALQVA
ncbi:MAG: hypothetical protein QM533_09570 [Cytophagales bacterium]|nr:hypothetical protein [Cytophagales bacterium]